MIFLERLIDGIKNSIDMDLGNKRKFKLFSASIL